MVVVPAAKPVNTPPTLIVPVAGLALLHTPPPVASLKFTVAPIHRVLPPDMLPTVVVEFTLTIFVAATVPQPLVTV